MSESPQFQRTGKAITQALIELLHTKPFEKITVQDILDKTPVTRATFYAHFHDKYEIVEKMMDRFFEALSQIRSKVRDVHHSSAQTELQTFFLAHRELTQALLKIHTEKVDFRQAFAKELEQEYLVSADSPTSRIEARVYAQALTEMYLAFLDDDPSGFSLERTKEVFLAVALKLLNISDDPEARRYLSHRLEHL